MEMTDYASQKLLEGTLPFKNLLEGDAQITIRKIKKKQGLVVLDIHLVEKGGGKALYTIVTGLVVGEGGTARIESPDGLMSIPVEIHSR